MVEQKDRILDQYKMYVETIFIDSTRRTETNKFFYLMQSALMVFGSVISRLGSLGDKRGAILAAIAVVGLGLNAVWFLYLRNYEKLLASRYEVCRAMEKEADLFPCFDQDFQRLRDAGYIPLSKMERAIPVVVGLAYVMIFLFLA